MKTCVAPESAITSLVFSIKVAPAEAGAWDKWRRASMSVRFCGSRFCVGCYGSYVVIIDGITVGGHA
jgi:hypothetical protein